MNQEYRRFNKNDEITCFRCFDGTFTLNSQFCDSIKDCQDLSDECTCEYSKFKPLSKVFYGMNRLNFTVICSLKYEFTNGTDEKYRSNHLLSIDKFELIILEQSF